LINLSEGYPHFIQQFGSSAFAADVDGLIDEEDVWSGALSERGALELIGDRYYRDDFYRRIQQDSYREVLQVMSDHLDSWVSKDEIRKGFKGGGSTLDNALKALRERDIIQSKEGQRGVYRLQHKAFALWITAVHERGSAASPRAAGRRTQRKSSVLLPSVAERFLDRG
jgi:hypothetical protein